MLTCQGKEQVSGQTYGCDDVRLQEGQNLPLFQTINNLKTPAEVVHTWNPRAGEDRLFTGSYGLASLA